MHGIEKNRKLFQRLHNLYLTSCIRKNGALLVWRTAFLCSSEAGRLDYSLRVSETGMIIITVQAFRVLYDERTNAICVRSVFAESSTSVSHQTDRVEKTNPGGLHYT